LTFAGVCLEQINLAYSGFVGSLPG
jgi:hypothetical protein